MIICVCKAVSESVLRERIAAGARSLEQLARETGVTTDCGTCTATVLEMLEETAAVDERTDRGGSE